MIKIKNIEIEKLKLKLLTEEKKMNIPRVGTAAIIINNNTILLGKRDKEPERGKWVLPGGKIEPFETMEETLKREIFEETGLLISVIDQLRTFELIDKEKNQHRIIIYQFAEIIDGQLIPSSDISEIKFFKKEELKYLDITEFVKNILTYIKWYE
jgi:ADP-ribose pyrophosphatase YjhB (NUDIX family)